MSVITKDTIQPSSGQPLTIKDEGGTASITVATNGEATFAENIKVTNGKGIDFSAVSGSHSGSSSSVLDDYEEGVYQPTITFDSGGSMATGGSNTYLAYTKIGRLVYVSGSLTLSSESSPSGNMIMSLPFANSILAEAADLAWGNCYWSSQGGTIINGGVTYATAGNTFIYFSQINDTGTFTYITSGTLDSVFPKYMRLNVTYLT